MFKYKVASRAGQVGGLVVSLSDLSSGNYQREFQ